MGEEDGWKHRIFGRDREHRESPTFWMFWESSEKERSRYGNIYIYRQSKKYYLDFIECQIYLKKNSHFEVGMWVFFFSEMIRRGRVIGGKAFWGMIMGFS